MNITLEQELAYYTFINKWYSIVTSTTPVNQSKAREAIYYAYELAKLPMPEIYFASSPKAQQVKLKSLAIGAHSRELIRPSILIALTDLLLTSTGKAAFKIGDRLSNNDYVWTLDQKIRSFAHEIESKLKWRSATYFDELIISFPEVSNGINYLDGEFIECAWLDFAVNVLQLEYPLEVVKAFHNLIKNCGLTRQLRNILIVCDRPSYLSLDHPLVVKFSDGFTI